MNDDLYEPSLLDPLSLDPLAPKNQWVTQIIQRWRARATRIGHYFVADEYQAKRR
jgi:hypothetical protein